MGKRPRISKGLWSIAVIGATALVDAQNQPVVKSGTELVRVSVLVRDRNGRPVTGLKAADFTITEDGKPQEVVFFDASGAASPGAPSSASASAMPAADAGATVFSNTVGSDRARNVTVILLDRLNTVWSDQAQAREGIRKFLSQLRPDDRVALYALDGTALRVLHDFTSDTSAFLKTLDSAARLTSTAAEAQDPNGLAALGNAGEEYRLHTIGQAAYTTITALQTIGRHLAAIPGHKSVVWISSAFPSKYLTVNAVDRTSEIQRATRALNTAGISVYPIDARGLIGAFSDPGTATRPPSFAGADTVLDNAEVMHGIADDTGGRVFINTNNIGGAIRSAIDDGDAYYVIGYYPPAAPNDGHYRQIDVKTRTSVVELRYRRGYYATAADASGSDRKTTLEHAIRDVLDATGIPVTVSVAPAGQNQELELSIAADGHAIALKNDQGRWTGSIDLAIAQIYADGSLHVDMDTTIALTLTDAQHDALLDSGLTLTRHITLAPTTARVATVIRDAGTGALGSVFVPAAKLRSPR